MPEVKLTTLDALRDAQIDGTRLVLPSWMDRKEYKAVDQVLRNLGGTWNRQAKAHVFAHDPTEAVREVVESGQAPGPPKRDEGYVRTPTELAVRIVRDLTDIGDWSERGTVLEPSAGDGSLAWAIRAANPEAELWLVEPNGARAAKTPAADNVFLFAGRLEEFLHDDERDEQFDAVVANPPFAVPGRPTVWIEHTWHAWSLLAPGGRLVSIAPKGIAFREDRKHREIRELIERYGGSWIDLDTGAFAEAGTQVNAVVFWIDKPHDWTPDADRPAKKRGKPSEQAKQQRREEDLALRQAATEALDDPEYARTLADRVNATPIDCRLRSYSPRNQAMVLNQADALGVQVTGHLNTFKGWQEQGRMVAKGSTALRIIAAMGDEPDQESEAEGGDETERRKRFRVTTRFEYSQTTEIEEDA